MPSNSWLLCAALALLGTPLTLAQETAPAPQDNASAPAGTVTPSPWTRNGIDIYLLGDVYGDVNFNHPANGFNQLYNFDDRANQAHLSLAKVSLEKASGVLGFRVDVGVGRTLDLISAADGAPSGLKYLEQVYLEVRSPGAHGLQIDLGKFASSAGAEVIESNNNWNYSRSLLFVLAVPYYHFGMRTSMPINKIFTAGIQLVNGWNSVGNDNSLETVGLVGNFTWKKVVWSNDFYSGPQHEGSVRAYRQLYDTTVVLNPSAKASVYVNFDVGSDKRPSARRSAWIGGALAGRYQLTGRFAIAPRVEIFDDVDGFATGTSQIVEEGTLTGELKIREGVLGRLEYRHDASNKPFYDRGANLAIVRNQSTVALGFIVFFGPKK